MSKRGWHLNALQNPAALHMAFTVCTRMMIRLQEAELMRLALDGNVGV
jgi:hypothetical protein